MVYRLPIPPRIPLKTQLAASIVQRIRGGLFGEFDLEVGTVLPPRHRIVRPSATGHQIRAVNLVLLRRFLGIRR